MLTVGGLGPPTGSRTPAYHPDPPVRREPASCLGLVRSRQVSAGTGAARGFRWKTPPPTALNAGGLSALCRSRARGNFCQTTLLVSCYQGAQCSRRHRARNAHQPAAPVGYDDSAPPIMMPTLHLRGRPAGRFLSLARESTVQRSVSRGEIFNHCSSIMPYAQYCIHPRWAHLSGSQRLCTRLP